jgi:hypothetical protein
MATTSIQAEANKEPTGSGSAGGGRVVSIDALRGFDMFWLIRGYGVVTAGAALICPEVGKAVAGQFDHSRWVGFTFWDFVAPRRGRELALSDCARGGVDRSRWTSTPRAISPR